MLGIELLIYFDLFYSETITPQNGSLDRRFIIPYQPTISTPNEKWYILSQMQSGSFYTLRISYPSIVSLQALISKSHYF